MVPAARFVGLKDVQKKYSLDNIRFLTMATEARYSRVDGLWHLTPKDTQTGQVRQRTCNFLFSCQGVLTISNDPHFDTAKFAGKVFHSAEWDKSVDLRDKNVVVVGNGCPAVQLIPNIVDQSRSVNQICRLTQCILPKTEVPGWVEFGMKWVPGVNWSSFNKLPCGAVLALAILTEVPLSVALVHLPLRRVGLPRLRRRARRRQARSALKKRPELVSDRL